ncbi:MAG: hypothetical protein WC055_13210 [Melioribacteraceae bacterium]
MNNYLPLIVAIIIVGIVWGGFVFFVSIAIKFEKGKKPKNA